MKKKSILNFVILLIMTGVFSKTSFTQALKNGKVVLNLTHSEQVTKLKSDDATIKQSKTNGITLSTRSKRATIQSASIKVPLEGAEPFLAVGFLMQHSEYDGNFSIYLRNSKDNETWSEWEMIDNSEQEEGESYSYASDLLFLNKDIKYVQFLVAMKKSNGKLPAISEISLYFVSPGAINKEAVQKSLMETKKQHENADPTTKSYTRPAYVNRKGWGCPQAENTTARTLTTVTHLVLHHSAANTTSDNFPGVVLSYWDWHVNGRGWADIGYNWLVNRNGVVYKGRAWYSSTQENVQGAHNSINGNTSGICMIGNFVNSALPSTVQWNQTYEILAFLCDKFGLDPTASTYHAALGRVNDVIDGHKDSGGYITGTTCPENIANYYTTIRNAVKSRLGGASGPENLSAAISECPDNNVTFDWDNSGTGWQIHVSTSSSFSTYYLKWVSGLTTYTGPEYFVSNSNGDACPGFNEGTLYYWRMYYNGSYTSTKTFTMHNCSEITYIDDFETDEGHFNLYPTYSGTTLGVSASSSQERTTSEAYRGNASLKTVLYDNTSSSYDWTVRLLSGSGLPSDNTAFESTGTITFWLKTSTAASDAAVQIWVDDSDGLEASPFISISSDDTWHQYSFDLADFNGTTITAGNGELDNASVTLDAIVLQQSNTCSTWTAFIDDVAYNPSGSGTSLKKSLNQELSTKTPDNPISKIRVYPNPCQGLFTIETSASPDQVFEVNVYNTTGSVVYSETLYSNKKLIDIQNLPGGMYFVNIRNNDTNKTLSVLKQ